PHPEGAAERRAAQLGDERGRGRGHQSLPGGQHDQPGVVQPRHPQRQDRQADAHQQGARHGDATVTVPGGQPAHQPALHHRHHHADPGEDHAEPGRTESVQALAEQRVRRLHPDESERHREDRDEHGPQGGHTQRRHQQRRRTARRHPLAARLGRRVLLLARALVGARRHPGRPARPAAPRAAGAGAADLGRRSHPAMKFANAMPPATKPTPANPRPDSTAPRAGPKTKPMPLEAPTRPSARVRSWGSVRSTTYACATGIAPPNSPATNLAANSVIREPAIPVNARENADRARAASSTGRRPNRSDSAPSTGAAMNWAAAYAVSTPPTHSPEPPSCSAWNGSSGRMMPNPSMSTKTARQITSNALRRTGDRPLFHGAGDGSRHHIDKVSIKRTRGPRYPRLHQVRHVGPAPAVRPRALPSDLASPPVVPCLGDRFRTRRMLPRPRPA